MNRKAWVTYSILAAVLILGIAAAVHFLYGKESSVGRKVPVTESFILLDAVPSDAAVILCSEDFGRSAAELSDSTSLMRLLVSDGRKNPFYNYLAKVSALMTPGSEARSLHTRQMALSLHYSGSMLPLMIVQLHEADSLQASLLTALASECSLSSAQLDSEDGRILLVSESETLVGSSRRHLSEGVSILSDKSFADCASSIGGKEVLFISHQYTDRLSAQFLSKQLRKKSSFIRGFADWTAFSIESVRDGKTQAVGITQSRSASGHFTEFLSSIEPTELSFEDVVPSTAVYALAAGLKDTQGYIDEFQRLCVSDQQKYKSEQEKLRKRSGGVAPQNWAQALQIREVVRTAWLSSDGKLLDAVMVRVGKRNLELITGAKDSKGHRASLQNLQDYNFGGYAASLFGQAFAVDNESAYVMTGEWIVSGSPRAIEEYGARLGRGDCLRARLDEAGAASVLPLGSSTMAAYFSPVGWESMEYCSKSLSGVADEIFASADYEPMVISFDGKSFELKIVKEWNSNQ